MYCTYLEHSILEVECIIKYVMHILGQSKQCFWNEYSCCRVGQKAYSMLCYVCIELVHTESVRFSLTWNILQILHLIFQSNPIICKNSQFFFVHPKFILKCTQSGSLVVYFMIFIEKLYPLMVHLLTGSSQVYRNLGVIPG